MSETITLLFVVALMGANSLLLSPLLPDVAAAFAVADGRVAIAMSVYGAATAGSAFVLARTVDRFGARRVLRVAAAIFAGAMALAATAPALPQLIVAQGLAGLAAGVALPAAYGAASTSGGPKTLGRVMTGWSVAMVAAIPLGALATDLLGWRSPFVVLGLCAAALIVPLGALPAGGDRAAAPGPLAALRLGPVRWLLAGQLFFSAGFYGAYALLGAAYRDAMGLSAGAMGALVIAYGVGFAVASVGDGWMARHRVAPPLAFALAGLTVALLPAASSAFAAAALALFTWGVANHLALTALVSRLSAAGGAARGAALGLNTTITYCGSGLGPLAAAALMGAGGFSWVALAAASAHALAAVCLLWGSLTRPAAHPQPAS
ncbi:MAG: MFS transporter [Pseudomonadota bacterium]